MQNIVNLSTNFEEVPVFFNGNFLLRQNYGAEYVG